MKNRYILIAAQAISTLFTPFYLPTEATVVLMTFSYLNSVSMTLKLALILIVYLMTVLFPRIIIYLYRKYHGWSNHQMSRRERRYVPYIISIVCFSLLLLLLELLHMPHFISAIIAAALLIQIICAIINNWIKVSTHAAASAGIVSMLFAFSLIFNFDATNWIALSTLLCGCVCSARMILRQHTYHELLLGVITGIISGYAAVLLV